MSDSWNRAKALQTYSVPWWSGGYFDIDDRGRLVARPDGGDRAVPLLEVARRVREAGLTTPVLVRFLDILRDRVARLGEAFGEAMEREGYGGGYTTVYPIKVNQQRAVVEEILSAGGGRVGLEAGSKPELLAAMGLLEAGGLVICNGYKDREYIRLALVGQQLGLRLFLVVEKRSELELIFREAESLGVRPRLGVRVRLASLGAGNWQNTGGEKAKFGLSSAELLQLVEALRERGWLERLQLLHFHMGSQIAHIRDIQKGMAEGARFYAQLRALGAPITRVDVGGGLGVDYEGTRSRSYCSMNYDLTEYARNVVRPLWEVCEAAGLPHPDLVTESGRAITAHHAVLVTDVIDHEPPPGEEEPPPPRPGDPMILRDLWNGLQALHQRSALEAWHDAVYWLEEARNMFNLGLLSLAQRAHAEQLYFATCQRLRPLLNASTRTHRAVIDELNEVLADKYFCNFSVFQSVPDVWAIDQIFPILPLGRLDEPPNRRVVIQDLTCDSDGRIGQYVENGGVERTLPVHEPRPGEPCLLGLFMVGAYQEILGDMHNLFGDTDSVNVRLNDGGFDLEEIRRGDTVADVLAYVHLDADRLLARYRERAEAAEMDGERRRVILTLIQEGLQGYTYLEP